MNKKDMKQSSRYPYTYAADYLRQSARRDDGTLFSRSEASQMQRNIADGIGMSQEEMAKRLANEYIELNAR